MRAKSTWVEEIYFKYSKRKEFIDFWMKGKGGQWSSGIQNAALVSALDRKNREE